MLSTALAIAAVSATLKRLLEDGLAARDLTARLGDLGVTALPPDRITTGEGERPQLNLFLYLITPNTALRQPGAAAGRGQPLAIDLHYLLSAYGAKEFQIETLLGAAVQLFQRHAQIDRAALLDALATLGDGERRPVTADALAEQILKVSVTPQFLDPEALSRLWSALQARYRPSVAYKISLVVIEP